MILIGILSVVFIGCITVATGVLVVKLILTGFDSDYDRLKQINRRQQEINKRKRKIE